MSARRVTRFALVAAAMSVLLIAVACDDDGDGEASPTPASSPTTVAIQPTATPEPPLPTPGPSAEPAARIELFASPQQLTCDGGTASIVTARVYDASDRAVEDGTQVHFSVVTLGTANPINAQTRNGVAESAIVALGSRVGVTVTVSSGEAEAAIRVDCL